VDNPLVQPDPGLFIWTILTFLILVFLLRKFAWGPLLEFLAAREKLIASAVENAEKARAELQNVQANTAGMLAEARREAGDLVTRARADADRFREDLRARAAAEAAALTRNAEQEIARATAQATEQIRREAVNLSVDIASRLVQRTLTPEDNERLIQDTIAQLDASRH
jgi:F-type H+-transporting ATPase subunit b